MTQDATHRAIVRTGRRLVCRRLTTPVPGPGDAMVAVDYVGVCGTDLQILNGTRPGEAVTLRRSVTETNGPIV